MTVEKKIVGKGPEVLLLLGYGVRLDHPGVKWLFRKFEKGGVKTTFLQLPVVIEDFREDILDPVNNVRKDMRSHAVIGFSLGGLTASFLHDAEKRIFLSPFWGLNEEIEKGWMKVALKGLRVVRLRILPSRYDLVDMGYYSTEEDLKGMPEFMDFHTISEMMETQKSMPPPEEGDIVYWSPQDPLISHDAVREREVRTREYKGGHMVYLVKDRERIFDEIVGMCRDTLESGND